MTGLEPLDIFINKYCSVPGKFLDVGGDGSIIDTNVTAMGHKYESLNLGRGTFDVEKDPWHWPMISDNTYDYVISITAFEHIEFFWMTFLEMVRVTKPDGIIYILAPSTGALHPNPLDCYRFFPDGMRALGKWGNVEIIDTKLYPGRFGYCEGIFRKEGHEPSYPGNGAV
jgi:SAM-dependent methyltransferase